MFGLNTKKKAFLIGTIVTITITVASYYYSKIFSENLLENTVIYIPNNATIDHVKDSLGNKLKRPEALLWVAQKKKYTKKIRSGKFALKAGMSSNDLINHLRSGAQIPVKLTFNNQHRLESLAGRISEQIEADSVSLMKAFTNAAFLEKKGFSQETALCMYIPNSYEIYWSTSAEEFRNRMHKEYERFWNSHRISKAQKQNLSIEEVIVLASIVQKETANVAERPIVAGLYLNRYRKGWALQADPTVIFALQQKYGQDFKVKRVLSKDLKTNSPYNTYQHKGLPPGPISMPDISSIDAVLNPANHKYYYMCASTDIMGTHTFAKTLRQHKKNARKYQRWLSKQGIKR